MILEIIFPFICFIVGVIFASFSNMLMYRLTNDKPIIKESHSYCPNCGNYIKWYDNIPILSYLILRGKCRSCGKPISKRYILVELYGGVLFVGVYLLYTYVYTKFDYCFTVDPLKIINSFCIAFILLFLLVSAYVDKNRMIAPLSMSIVMFVLAATKYISYACITKDYGLIYLLGLGIPFVLFLLIYLVSLFIFKVEPMGLGDIILFSILGLAFGVYQLILLVFFSSTICAVIEIIKIKKTKVKNPIPFVPYIYLGALIVAVAGPIIIKGINTLLGGQ